MFEIFFKYPVSLFQKGHFVFLTPWPLWLMAVGIVVAAGMLFWHIHRNHGMLSGARPIAIWLLETAMAALLLFLLWHPALSVATLKPQQNVIAVLVDNSRTMAIADASGTREAAAAALVQDGLAPPAGRFQVRLYEFGKEPQRIQKPEQLTAAEPATRIGDALEGLLAESSSLPGDLLVRTQMDLSAGDGATLAMLHEFGRVLSTRYENNRVVVEAEVPESDRKSTRLNSSHLGISYA